MFYPFQSFLCYVCQNVQILIHFLQFLISSHTPYFLFCHRSTSLRDLDYVYRATLLKIFLSHIFSLFISVFLLGHVSFPYVTTLFAISVYISLLLFYSYL
jgi:hypothetical protein